ncbi:hypothetical protein [Sandaracinus amylolyticus]|uniref:Uncharacterized protein n=1 Tax=Sandaracinus amylolyticus TaxID=927083 RepID=A0A0F6W120_9BACT|nr:hypothetical protein [Sandaracinus amylolyticus]AKF04762.1 Hypothetical protein DB32_001911 [Sandaracinus amylolyticus]
MREWTLTARLSRAWFVVALSAIAGLTIASPLASAQTTEDADEAAPAQEQAPSDGATEAPASPEAAESAEAAASPEAAESAEAAGSPEAATPPDETTEAAQTDATTTSAPDSALQPGDIEAEEAAASGEDAAAEEVAAEEAQAQREPLPWRNSFFSWTHGITPNSFFRGAQLSYDPMYYWSFNLAPRWYLDSATFFALSQSLSVELTDDGLSSVNNREPMLSDTIVELRRTIAWEGFIFIPAGRVVLPASKASQAQQRYFGLAGGLTAVRVIPEAASLTFALIGRYQYWFAGRNTPGTLGTYPAQQHAPSGDLQGGNFGDQASALTGARHVITAGLNVTIMPLTGLTVSAAAFWQSQEGHGLGTACTPVDTLPGGELCLGDNSDTHWRHFTSVSLSVAYDVQSWLNLSIGWSNATVLAPLQNDDGSARNIFNPDNNFFLTATVQIDALFETLRGAEDDGLTPEQRQRRRQGLAGVQSTTGGSF